MFRAPLCPSSGAGDYIGIQSMWQITLVMVWCVAVGFASGLRDNLQPHTTPKTSHNQSYVPHAVNTYIVSSSWW